MENHFTEFRSITKRNTLRGFILAITGHLIVFALYYAATAIAETKDEPMKKKPPGSFTDLIPPPSLSEKPMEAAAIFSPSVDLTKPAFGIPIPVPDMKDISSTLPDINSLYTPSRKGDTTSTLPSGKVVGTYITEREIPKEQPKKTIADPGVYIEHTEDPMPIRNIQQLITYPEVAKRSGIEGRVIASVFIGTTGIVEKVVIEKSDNEIFNSAAESALLMARFTPARNGESPVAIWWTVPISFKLSK